MATSVKTRSGRPRGQRRPVLAFRVPEELYAKLQRSADDNGRTISGEANWRIRQSFERSARRKTIGLPAASAPSD